MGKKSIVSKSSSSSDDDSSSSSSSADSEKYRKEMKKIKKKLKKEEKRKEKRLKKELKNERKKLKKEMKKKREEKKEISPQPVEINPVEKSSNISIKLMEVSRKMTPMTKEEWEKRQSVIRKVYCEDSGRYRLIKGDGEVLEEIVSYKQHKEINKKSTLADGEFFQSQTTNKKPKK